MSHHYGAKRMNPAHIYSGMDTKPKPRSTTPSAEVGKMSATCEYCQHIVRAVRSHWEDLEAVPPIRQGSYILSKHTAAGTRGRDTQCRGSGTRALSPSIFQEEIENPMVTEM